MGSTSLVVPQESSLPIERCRRRLSRKRRFKEEWDLILGVFPRQLGQQDNSQEDLRASLQACPDGRTSNGSRRSTDSHLTKQKQMRRETPRRTEGVSWT